ncbi:MAG: DUF1800 family protein [Chloroflexota bacterium]
MSIRINRRNFLQATGVLGAAAAASYLPTAYAHASAPQSGLSSAVSSAGRQLVQPININLSPEAQAARFLVQATLGANYELVQEVKDTGIEAWLEAQFELPINSIEQLVIDYVKLFPADSFELPFTFDWSWWQHIMTSPDVVRQRVAFALSEIFVISRNVEDINENGRSAASYYDLLLTHAFGNYRDLLLAITLHPSMGIYLSHMRNRKSDPSKNRYPDENYAREVMQLFSIGLFELNQDGTEKLDENGDPIPTYTNADITEFAKIFTGLAMPPNPEEVADWAEEGEEFVIDEEWFLNAWGVQYVPMIPYEQEHEPGEKRLLNGTVVPAGQTTMQDIEAAIDNLFNHPNVGPFMGRLLIQRLVKSNPTPAYISRVAATFNDNGAGVRGDLKAVVRAILLDEEARDLNYMTDPANGMLREPLVRYISLCRTFNAANQSGEYTFAPDNFREEILQYILFAPSVFNFFLPSYQPIGPVADAGLVAPEFQITTSLTTISTANLFDSAIFEAAMPMERKEQMILEVQEEIAMLASMEEETTEEVEAEEDETVIRSAKQEDEKPRLFAIINGDDDEHCEDEEEPGDPDDSDGVDDSDAMDSEEPEDGGDGESTEEDYYDPALLNLDTEMALAETDIDAMINRLDLLLTYHTMTPETFGIIRSAAAQLDEPMDRVNMALSLIVLSPEYTIAK